MENINNLIEVKQLPIVEERLKQIKGEIELKIKGVLSLDCTEESVKAVKKLRAVLRKDFEDLESRRKAVKAEVLAPYEDFEKVYKEYITDIFTAADNELKSRIDSVENALKTEKKNEVEQYFNECLAVSGIDFITFDDCNINITKSATLKRLREDVKEFVEGIKSDLAFINTQDYSAEILYHFKKRDGEAFLNSKRAISLTVEQKRGIQAEMEKSVSAGTAQVNTTAEAQSNNEAAALSAPTEIDEKIYSMRFTVYATKEQLRELKNFIIERGIRYE